MQSPQRKIENWKIYSMFWKVNWKCILQVFVPWRLPVHAGLITRYVQWVMLLKNVAYITNIWKILFQQLPVLKPGWHLRGNTHEISRCKVIVLCPFHWCFTRGKKFSLKTQKIDIGIIYVVKSTKQNYSRTCLKGTL